MNNDNKRNENIIGKITNQALVINSQGIEKQLEINGNNNNT